MNKQNKDLILLILDMQGIEDRLREFERKYRLRSSVFYDCFNNRWNPCWLP